MRVIVLITLLSCAVVALRGHVPGALEPHPPRLASSALTVLIMPVLVTVSIVVLVAGIIASRHRLPLALPEVEDEEPTRSWNLGRSGIALLVILGLFALITGAVWVLQLLSTVLGDDAPPPPSQSPETTGTEPPPPESVDPGTPGLTGVALVVTVVAAVVLVLVALGGLGVVAVAARPESEPPPAPLPEPEPEAVGSLARAAEMGLAAMNAPGQDARTAIIACYVAMERGLASGRSAAPQISDTPTEVLARAFEFGALHDTSARELVALFEEARFSPHDMFEWQRMRAEQLLRIVLEDLQGVWTPYDTQVVSRL